MAFEEELSKLKQDMSELNMQIIEINTNSIDLKTAYDDSKTELEKWEREIKIHSSNFDEMHKNYKQIDENRAQHKEAMAYYEKLYDEQVAKMNEKQSSIAQQERELEVIRLNFLINYFSTYIIGKIFLIESDCGRYGAESSHWNETLLKNCWQRSAKHWEATGTISQIVIWFILFINYNPAFCYQPQIIYFIIWTIWKTI